ncbi:hypothetical protein V2J09_001529 [Rumex salicifolius]
MNINHNVQHFSNIKLTEKTSGPNNSPTAKEFENLFPLLLLSTLPLTLSISPFLLKIPRIALHSSYTSYIKAYPESFNDTHYQYYLPDKLYEYGWI